MHTAVIPIEQLLEHRAWVRALARRLVLDESQVDDVEQQTWLAAIERPPKPGSARAWLSAVVRNVSSKLRRTEARLAERHDRLPTGGPAPSTADVVAQAELHQAVVKAVLALDEPYRTTLLLRYFEGLPPREIAKQMDAPVETVRVRSRRAMERIRKDLDKQHGSRPAWQLALVPLTGIDPVALAAKTAAGGSAATASLGTGVLIMSTQMKFVLVAVAALLVVGLVVWNPFSSTDPEPPPIIAGGDGDGDDPEPDDPGLEGLDVETADVPEELDSTPPVAEPEGPWILVTRRTTSGTERPPTVLATFVDDAGQRLDAEGRHGVLAVPSGVEGAAVLWLTTVDDEGFYRFDARAYPAGKTEVEVEPPARVELRFRTENGVLDRDDVERRYEAASHAFIAHWIAEGRFTSVDPIRSRIDNRINAAWTIQAEWRWQDDAIRVSNTPTGGTWRLLVSRAGATPKLLDVPALEPGKTVRVDVPLPAAPTLQRVRIVDRESGDALPGVLVTPYYEHGDDEAFFAGVTRTADEFGEISIPYGENHRAVRAPHWRVENDTHLGMLSPSVFREHPEVFEYRVQKKATIRGTAWLRNGQPAAGALVVSGVKGKMAMAEVDEQGRFELVDVLVGPSYTYEPGSNISIILVEDLESMSIRMEKVRPKPGDVIEIQIGKPKLSSEVSVLTGRITAGGVPLPEQYVIIKAVEDNSKGAFVKTDADGRYRHEGVPPGPLELRVYLGNPQVADDFWIRSAGGESGNGTFEVVPGETTTIDFELPAGRLRVKVQAEDGKPLMGVAVLGRPAEDDLDESRFDGYRYSMGWSGLSNKDGVVELYGLAPNTPLVLMGGQREANWKFEQQDIEAMTGDEPPEVVIVKPAK